ncbi:uroporphyrinogen-III synthase [Altererythrobacter sp.]|nr:uroporphyrinogen-III synthase [Altererythrobacter sp.]
MARPVFVFRPEPGLTQTLIAAHGLGLKARGMPLSTVEPLAWTAPSVEFGALLIGSANAVRHGGEELEKVAHLPVLAVGETTATLARQAGLEVEFTGSAGLQMLLDTLPNQPLRLLRLAGEAHVSLTIPTRIEIETAIVYRVCYHALSMKQADLLGGGGVVLLHSGEAARHFSKQCSALGVERANITIAAMAPRIAESAGGGWESVHIAQESSDAALLALAAELCQ